MSTPTPNAAELADKLDMMAVPMRGDGTAPEFDVIFAWRADALEFSAALLRTQAARIAELEAALAQQVPEPQPVNAQLLAALEEADACVGEYIAQMSAYTISDRARACRQRIHAAIAAAEAAQAGSAQQVPAVPGWRLVPVEPTEAMLRADLGLRPWDGLPSLESRIDLRPHIWRAMLSAAPLPAQADNVADKRPVLGSA